MVKSAYYDKSGLKRGAWSPAEDNLLREYVQKYGHWNWRELPKFAGLPRCGKSCRLRWMNYLRPDVKLGKYTKEEDEIIIKLHEEHGNKWSMIATKLPGRTDNEIKNHWHTHLKKSAKENPTTSSKMKEQLSEASLCESSQNKYSEASHYILESSPLSSETCSSDFSSLSSNHPLLSGTNCAVEDSILASSETPDEFGGDFWTEPFLADNSFIQNSCPLVPFLDGGFISPDVSYHDDRIDLFWDLGL